MFSVTTFDEKDTEGQHWSNTRKTEAEISLIKSKMNHSEVEKLSQNVHWKQKFLNIVQGINVYLSLVGQLPTEARLPRAIYCAVCQFGMIALEVQNIILLTN